MSKTGCTTPFAIAVVVASTLAATGWGSSARGQATDVKQRNRYRSRYVVRVDPSDLSILALDFNRTSLGDSGRVQYEYKGWRARGAEWDMFLYDVWTAPSGSSWPARKGFALTVDDESGEMHITGEGVDVRTEAPVFAFDAEKDQIGRIRTAHVPLRSHDRRAVLEWVVYHQRASAKNEEERAERARRLDPHAFFGRYDWLVLADSTGRLIQVSSGSLTEDFAYRVVDGVARQTHDASIQWLETERDARSGRHVPVRWAVDVPAWGLRAELSKLGEHRGHGDPRPDGMRPVYRQVSVAGPAHVDGEPTTFFGMVEAIQD